MNIKSIVESLLFAWGEHLSINEISKLLNMSVKTIEPVLNEMVEEYEKDSSRGLCLQKYGNSYQLTTKKENYEYIQNLLQTSNNRSLTTAAMETLSIIAYKQPITKVEIELIRGVKCVQVIKGLQDKGLIKEVGKLDKPGRPTIYSTTDGFLKHFGLKSLNDLPKINIELQEEKKAT